MAGPLRPQGARSLSALRLGVPGRGPLTSLRRISPQHLYNIESEIEESDYDSVEGSTSGASSDEWEDDSDSWETDNGLVEDELKFVLVGVCSRVTHVHLVCSEAQS